MARIMAVDYGLKRIGLAVTDPLQIIVSGLDTVDNADILDFLDEYFKSENVEKLIIGWPEHKDGNPTRLGKPIDSFIKKLCKKYPDLIIEKADESFTSQRAKEIIFASGAKKSKRRDKKLVDKMSAVIILQQYLNHI